MKEPVVQGSSAVKSDEVFTYKEYKTWPDDQRWELIEGRPYSMSPAPTPKHQRFLGVLNSQLENFFSGKPCRPYLAPVDVILVVELEDQEDSRTVVQPDAFVVCDPSKLVDEGIIGAPDFVIEILSASTAMKDQGEKRILYEKFGVKEYWVVNPLTYEVLRYFFREGKFGLAVPADLRNPVEVSLFPDLFLSVKPEDL
ncbi:MAG: Uma2 family endonuclease [Spirochaetales bacterium]|nr:Uma2 family endonuclease [Spirochaetales bacterium]